MRTAADVVAVVLWRMVVKRHVERVGPRPSPTKDRLASADFQVEIS